MRDSFLVFGAPQIETPEIEEVVETLKSRWIGTGPRVARLEREFAAYKGVPEKHVAAVNSCTAALHLSLIAADVGPGDEVITTAMTFCATVNTIIHAGATPVIVDIDPKTRNMDPQAVADAVTTKTRAILPVHFAGYPCDMDAIMEVADKHGLKVIEDCAHAIETEYRGRKAGTMGDFGCFSFYVTKNMVTGEGGMVLGKDEAAMQRIRRLALHGMSHDAWRRFSDSGYKHYFVEECGFKYNMMDLQAAIGVHQLVRLETNWARRREIWRRYQADLAGLPVGLPRDPDSGIRHAYHLYAVTVDDSAAITRDELLQGLGARRIGTGVHYLAIPEHPYYRRRFGWRPAEYPHASHYGLRTLSIPLTAALSDSDVEDVIDALRSELQRR